MTPKTLFLVACALITGLANDVYSQSNDARIRAEASSGCTPTYPLMSKRMGEQGTVQLKVLIDAKGGVSDIQIVKSSGFQRLDREASLTVKCMKFEPGRVDGLPVAMWIDFPLTFKLQ